MGKKSFRLIIVILVFITTSYLYCEVLFKNVDINKNGDILFSVNQETLNGKSYASLFLYSKNKRSVEQLSFFPEKLELLDNNKFLQISNNNSFARIELGTGKIYSQSEFESISQAKSSKIGSLKNIQFSPDGRWMSFLEPTSLVYGKLILVDTLTEKQFALTTTSVRNSEMLKWAPNSKTFLYEEEGILYFAKTNWFSSNTPLKKEFRQLAKGSIKNLKWISNTDFVFLSGSVIYRINSAKLFTQSFYAPIFPIGKLLARIPLEFDQSSDDIFLAPNGRTAVFIKSNRTAYYFKLNGDDYISMQDEGNIPFLLLPGNTAKILVYWKNNKPIIFSEAILNGKQILNAWEIPTNELKFKKISISEQASFLAASPKFKTVALKEGEVVSFYDTSFGWKKKSSFYDEEIISAVWQDENYIFLGGENSLIKYDLEKNGLQGNKTKICLTGAKDFCWSNSGDKILIEVIDSYKSNIIEYTGKLQFKPTNLEKLNRKKTKNLKERIYIDSTTGYFKNMIYIRSLDNYSTQPLFIEPITFAKTPTTKETSIYSNSSSIFSHGKRNGKKQVALAFDAMENIDGIAKVLYILKKHNIKATFFINGDALRQNPNAMREIARAGHQCGSLFFTSWNLSDTNYRIDENFIKQGLARNEDNFYAITGSELSLIWHTPNYIASSMMINAGKKAGYIYVSPDIRTPDWINSESKKLLPNLYKNAPQIIEELCQSVDAGSIIPIRLGKTFPPRGDYFYSYLELLITVLKEMGYSITNIQTLMEN